MYGGRVHVECLTFCPIFILSLALIIRLMKAEMLIKFTICTNSNEQIKDLKDMLLGLKKSKYSDLDWLSN